MKTQSGTFGFGDELSAVEHLDLRIRSAVGVRLLTLDGPDHLLARDHLTKHHMNSARRETRSNQHVVLRVRIRVFTDISTLLYKSLTHTHALTHPDEEQVLQFYGQGHKTVRQNVNTNLINTKTMINAHLLFNHHMIIGNSQLNLGHASSWKTVPPY